MRAIPVPVLVVSVMVLLALGISGAHGLFRDRHEALVLEPNDRATAARLGTLEPDEPLAAPPTLPAVPVLAPGTSLARSRGEAAGAAEAGDDLSAEMRLCAEARRTMGEDPPGRSLLEQHRERYPRGALREERDAYRIMLLRRLSHPGDAERALVDFRFDFPESHFLPMLAAHTSGPGE